MYELEVRQVSVNLDSCGRERTFLASRMRTLNLTIPLHHYIQYPDDQPTKQFPSLRSHQLNLLPLLRTREYVDVKLSSVF